MSGWRVTGRCGGLRRPQHRLRDRWARGLRAPDEEDRLVQLARDPRFREAAAWQSREALRGAVDKLAAGRESPSRRRRRAEVVAGYWQRYWARRTTRSASSAAWVGAVRRRGRRDRRPRRGAGRQRVVHLETWAAEAVARAVGDDALLPMHPFPERDLHARLDGNAVGVAALDRLEAAPPRSRPPHRMLCPSHSMSSTAP